MFGKLSDRYKQWKDARKERGTEAMMARAADLDESQEHDLLSLHDQGIARARATGQSIRQVSGKIENLIRKRLQVMIKPGTYFVAHGNHQILSSSFMVLLLVAQINLFPTNNIVHSSDGDMVSSGDSEDVVNGGTVKVEQSVGFLLGTGEEKYIPGSALPQEAIDLMKENYIL